MKRFQILGRFEHRTGASAKDVVLSGIAWRTCGPYLALATMVCVVFLAAPTDGNFSWSDAPRHAMNGVFVLDFLSAFPLQDPRQFAIDYYIQYPALTILFYPPLMPLVMAVFYFLFGISRFVAQASVAVFHFGLASGTYVLARRYLPRWQSVAASLLLVGAPEVAFWARQVMLDIPAFAWLVWGAVLFLNYFDSDRPRDLFASAALLLCAVYTKQVVAFALLVFVLVIAAVKGPTVLRRRYVVCAMILTGIALVPEVFLTLKFGQVNLASVSGAWPGGLDPGGLAAWTYYLEEMPSQLGWPTTILAVFYLAGAAFRPGWRLKKQDMVFLLSWFAVGYFFFSVVALKEPRHNLTTLLPVPIFAVLFLNRLVGPGGQKWATSAAIALAVATAVYSIGSRPVPYIDGYAQAARFVIERTPKHCPVVFSGYRDGSFIFNVRADGRRNDFAVLRADKLLLRVVIKREHGVQDRGFTADEIHARLNRHGVHYVVAEKDFWLDIPSMAELQKLLQDESRFEVIKRIELTGNMLHSDKELVIYRNRGPVTLDPEPVTLELLGIATTLQGSLRRRRGD